MSDIAIRIRDLSKQYRIGLLRHDTLRDSLSHGIRSVFRGSRAEQGRREDTIWALKDVSFDVRTGEVVGVIGRNGSGKSTLLKILSRITEPTAGYVQTKSKIGSLLEVGTGFHPELTGRENIYLNGAILGMKKGEIRRKFDEIVAFSEIEKFLDTPVKRYSSGMYVRLAFAVAAHMEPEILAVDEVLSVGDAAFQKKCVRKMGGIAREGRTVLFVSHNLRVVQSLCSRGILLHEGQVVEQGDIDDILQTYSKMVDSLGNDLVLGDRQDRQHGEFLRIIRVEFLDARDETAVPVVASGQDLLIRMHYECTSDQPLEHVAFGIAFFTIERTRLFGCRSSLVGVTYHVRPGRGWCTCRVRRWPLSSGTYTYNVHATQDSAVLDGVADAGTLNVASGDYYGTGRLSITGAHSVLVDFEWEAEPSNA
jgi:lipopolysaccharide transport system ATP-binding protein